MSYRMFLSVGALALMSVASADGLLNKESAHMAIQGALATGGTLSIGVVRYAPTTEIGVTVSGSVNNAPHTTQTLTPVIFAGVRKALLDRTYFAYGINFADTIGHQYGLTINADYQVGPYLSIEQMLTTHVMLSGWINPYQYEYQKIGGISTTTNGIFSAGGIAINYLF